MLIASSFEQILVFLVGSKNQRMLPQSQGHWWERQCVYGINCDSLMMQPWQNNREECVYVLMDISIEIKIKLYTHKCTCISLPLIESVPPNNQILPYFPKRYCTVSKIYSIYINKKCILWMSDLVVEINWLISALVYLQKQFVILH